MQITQCATLLLCAGLLLCAELLLLLQLLQLDVLLPLERKILLAAVVSGGCTGVYFSLLSPIAYASHSSGGPFWPHQRNQQMPHNHTAILTWCLHEDKAKKGNSTQPDKASVNKDRGCAGALLRKPSEL